MMLLQQSKRLAFTMISILQIVVASINGRQRISNMCRKDGIISSKLMFWMLFMCILWHPCHGEDGGTSFTDDGDDYYQEIYDDDNINDNLADDTDDVRYSFQASTTDESSSHIMVLIFSLLFGIAITLFAAFVGYFSILEDWTFRKYRNLGQTVNAKVVSTEFARAGVGGPVSIFTKPRDNPEYIAFVEYTTNVVMAASQECDNNKDDNDEKVKGSSNHQYRVRIRKQVKAKELDFMSSLSGREGKVVAVCATNASYGGGGVDDCCVGSPMAASSSWDNNIDVNKRRYLQLLVLPNHERSGYPAKQVARACSWTYRLSTIGLVTFSLLLAAFVTRLAAYDVFGSVSISHYAIYSFLLFLFVVEFPLIHYTFHDMFEQALREEYLENGEYLPLTCDDSSLSSGSDYYLA